MSLSLSGDLGYHHDAYEEKALTHTARHSSMTTYLLCPKRDIGFFSRSPPATRSGGSTERVRPGVTVFFGRCQDHRRFVAEGLDARSASGVASTGLAGAGGLDSGEDTSTDTLVERVGEAISDEGSDVRLFGRGSLELGTRWRSLRTS